MIFVNWSASMAVAPLIVERTGTRRIVPAVFRIGRKTFNGRFRRRHIRIAMDVYRIKKPGNDVNAHFERNLMERGTIVVHIQIFHAVADIRTL